MSYHWNGNASPSGGGLAGFLDPVGGGTNTLLTGTFTPCTPVAPSCGLNASATSITAGGNVNFTDGSSGAPTSWNWTFNGGTPGSSTAQNPGAVNYATPGNYYAILSASNAQGSCIDSVLINVSASTGCDTLNNFGPTDTLTVYPSPNGGYAAGVNGYDDQAKAEYYSGYAPYTHVNGCFIYLYDIQDGGNGSDLNVNIWDNTGVGGSPGAIIGTTSVSIADLVALQTASQLYVQINFPTAVNVGGNPFYIGVDFTDFGAGDTLGIVTNQLTDPTANSAWELWDTGTWNDMETAWGAGPWTMDIEPLVTDAPVTATATATTPTTVCVGGSISFDGSTSVNGTSYSWFLFGGTPSTATTAAATAQYDTAGTYTAYLVVDGSCGGQAIDSVVVTITAGPTLTSNSTPPGCGTSNGSISISATGGTPAYQYSIDNGVTFQASASFTGLAAGTYDIIVQDATGCTSTDQVILTAPGGPTATNNATDPGCAGNDGQIVINATGGTMPYTYSIDGGVTFQASNTFTGLSAGTYNIIVQDGNTCQTTDVTTLVASGVTISVTSTPVDPTCGNNDGSINVAATGGATPYQYSNDNGVTFQAGSSFSGLAAGSFNIVVQDAGGCTGTDVVSLTNAGAPTLSETHADVSCFGASDGTITLSGTGGTGALQYSINGGTSFQAGGSFTGLTGNTYNLVVEDINGCQDAMQVTIVEPVQVVHNTTVADASCGNNNGSITIVAGGGTGGYTYSIDGGVTFSGSGTFSNLAPGTYQVIVMDQDGCMSAMSTVIIGGTTAIVLTTSFTDETCGNANGTASVTASGGDNNYSYVWSNAATTAAISGLVANTYTVNVTDGSGCAQSATVVISNSGGVAGSVSPDATVCSGDTHVLSATGGTNYSWNDGTSNVGTGSTIAVNPTTTTIYTVTITDAVGCTQQLVTTVTVNSVPTTQACCAGTICAGESVTLVASGGTTYFWNTTETTANITVTPNTQTTYSVIAYNGTCAGQLATVVIGVDPAPTAIASASATNVAVNDVINFSNIGSVGTSYSWAFGDGQSSTTASPTHFYTMQGTYTVIMTATLGNCTASDTLTIIVGPVAIEEAFWGGQVSVFPNPTSGELNLDMDFTVAQDLRVTVMDNLGRIVYDFANDDVIAQKLLVDLSNEASGIYNVRIQAGTQQVTKRILLAR